jgi:hypothetical protein
MPRHFLQQALLCTGLVAGGFLPASGALAEASPSPLRGVSVSVTLDQGAVDVNSTQGQMKHFRESTAETLSDFEAFKQQDADGVRKEKEAFERYKEQVKREFIGYVQSITMQSGTEVVIVDNVAVERKASGSNPARDLLRRMRSENP